MHLYFQVLDVSPQVLEMSRHGQLSVLCTPRFYPEDIYGLIIKGNEAMMERLKVNNDKAREAYVELYQKCCMLELSKVMCLSSEENQQEEV